MTSLSEFGLNIQMVKISYGKGYLPLIVDPSLANWTIIEPKPIQAFADPEAEFIKSCKQPIGTKPLYEIIKPTDRVVIITSDGTRPVPNKLLVPWLLKIFPVPIENITILLGNGTHRENTREEIVDMFGEDIVNLVSIVNHQSYSLQHQSFLGLTTSCGEVHINKFYLEADKRIVLGFIEPHFFAGFSGGAKGIFPGIAGIETILHLHRAELIAHPMSTWGELDGNPIQREIIEMTRLCPPDFLINVTLNSKKEITGFFVGDYIDAHYEGCKKVKEVSITAVPHKYPIVITSNSGYPLDQNLYQTVKGISAAARIVEEGGSIIVASECSDGIPSYGNFANIMKQHTSPDCILNWIFNQKKTVLDQWQGQILAAILKKCEVALYSSLPSADVEVCKLTSVDDLQYAVTKRIKSFNRKVDVAVIPDGPLSITNLYRGINKK